MPDILYHYCSTDSFQEIIAGRSIRLSSLNLSNDTLEGKMVKRAIERLARRDALADDITAELVSAVEFYESCFTGFGFCLSTERDLLSQWRGYADDGHGVAIGFARSHFEHLASQGVESPFGMYKVAYEEAEHDQLIKATYDAAKVHLLAHRPPSPPSLLNGKSAEQYKQEMERHKELSHHFGGTVLQLFPFFYVLKSRAFREENEWRLIDYFMPQLDADAAVEYRPARDRIIPFKSLPLDQARGPVIAEIVLGPKHSTPFDVIERFVRDSGFGKVQVERSGATYR